jgi:saccharopine dehydrogenase (NAD+, L-lysine-forming)
MFGHAFKGQPAGQVLLKRFKAGGGTLYDLEYLVGEADGRRVAAFGYWAGYAGAAVSLKCWAAQQRAASCGPVSKSIPGAPRWWQSWRPIGPGLRRRAPSSSARKGRVGTGAADLPDAAMGVTATRWDMAETASGGPFPQVLRTRFSSTASWPAPAARSSCPPAPRRTQRAS